MQKPGYALRCAKLRFCGYIRLHSPHLWRVSDADCSFAGKMTSHQHTAEWMSRLDVQVAFLHPLQDMQGTRMHYSTVDICFFALCIFVVWTLISWSSERGLLYRWRTAFHDMARDFRGSKIQLAWVSLTIAMGA